MPLITDLLEPASAVQTAALQKTSEAGSLVIEYFAFHILTGSHQGIFGNKSAQISAGFVPAAALAVAVLVSDPKEGCPLNVLVKNICQAGVVPTSTGMPLDVLKSVVANSSNDVDNSSGDCDEDGSNAKGDRANASGGDRSNMISDDQLFETITRSELMKAMHAATMFLGIVSFPDETSGKVAPLPGTKGDRLDELFPAAVVRRYPVLAAKFTAVELVLMKCFGPNIGYTSALARAVRTWPSAAIVETALAAINRHAHTVAEYVPDDDAFVVFDTRHLLRDLRYKDFVTAVHYELPDLLATETS
ncbi:hypothetical protein GGF32_005727 [Allomyces javanicus]|nr:hypothetical protein GGF32_005727 [Allomyces javanicus]